MTTVPTLPDELPADDLSSRAERLCVSVKTRFGMPWDDAVQVAKVLDDLFNGRKEVDDEELSKDLRAMFYDLQSKDLLTTRREEFQSPEGKTLRAFYWKINEEALDETQDDTAKSHAERAVETDHVYEELPDEAWARNAA